MRALVTGSKLRRTVVLTEGQTAAAGAFSAGLLLTACGQSDPMDGGGMRAVDFSGDEGTRLTQRKLLRGSVVDDFVCVDAGTQSGCGASVGGRGRGLSVTHWSMLHWRQSVPGVLVLGADRA